MARVEIYTSPFCGYCHRAKALLQRKGVDFQETCLSVSPSQRAEMERRAGRHTVPQIFIDGRHVGGCDDLHALDKQGRLDAILGSDRGATSPAEAALNG